MVEYIERGKAVLAACAGADAWDGGCNASRDKYISEHIGGVPSADVAHVRHGRWIADKEDVECGNYLIRYRCSECKERPHFDKDKYKFILSHFCHNCGAKMDKDGNNG